MDNNKLVQTLFKIIDDLNPLLPEKQQLEKSLDTLLVGKSVALDSLGLIMMIEATEKEFHEAHEVQISLPYENAIQRNSPFQTIGTLVDYIAKEIEAGNE